MGRFLAIQVYPPLSVQLDDSILALLYLYVVAQASVLVSVYDERARITSILLLFFVRIMFSGEVLPLQAMRNETVK